MNKQEFEKAIRLKGGRKAMADALGVSPMAISHWLTGSRKFTVERAIEVEKLFPNGEITRQSLLPKIFDVVQRDAA